jgi:CubicO group peptidase (beta-lactamase class C family)
VADVSTSSLLSLDRSTPESQGVSSSAVNSFLDSIEAAPEIELHSLMILRHGRVITEGWWAPYSRDQVHLLYSLSKSFTSTAAGLAQAEGLLSLDDRVIDIFGEHADAIVDERSRELTLRQLARMATGHREDAFEPAYRNAPDDLVRGFLSVPLDEEPGSIFCYNNAATFVLGAAVQKRSGQTLVDYLNPRLFQPLGIDRCYWQSDTQGRNIGFSGLHVTTEAIARFGRLIIDGGRIGDRQILDPDWLATATSTQTDNSNRDEANLDWTQGYGYQFWMARHGFRGDGAYGQFCIVLPEQDALVITTAATENMQAVLDRVWEHLLPALGDQPLPEDGKASGDLAERLSSLTLTPVGSPTWSRQPIPHPDNQKIANPVRVVKIDSSSEMITLTLDHDDATQAPGRPSRDEPVQLEIGCGVGRWLSSEVALGDWTLSCAGSAVIDEDGILDAEVAFTNSPHRIRIRHGHDGVTTSGWITEPLGPPYPEALAIKLQNLSQS